MLFNIAADIAKLSLLIVCTYALLGAYARRRKPQWTEHLTKRRLAVLGMLTLAVGGIKRRFVRCSVHCGLRRRA